MRVDVMSTLRGVKGFGGLWRRRTTLVLPDGTRCDLLSLPDLVQAKKTQRDRDWPMIRRLIESHYFQHQKKPSTAQKKFWLQELRTPELLVQVTRANTALSRRMLPSRPLLAHAIEGESVNLELALMAEEAAERSRDREHWLPLRRQLEKLRHTHSRS